MNAFERRIADIQQTLIDDASLAGSLSRSLAGVQADTLDDVVDTWFQDWSRFAKGDPWIDPGRSTGRAVGSFDRWIGFTKTGL